MDRSQLTHDCKIERGQWGQKKLVRGTIAKEYVFKDEVETGELSLLELGVKPDSKAADEVFVQCFDRVLQQLRRREASKGRTLTEQDEQVLLALRTSQHGYVASASELSVEDLAVTHDNGVRENCVFLLTALLNIALACSLTGHGWRQQVH